MDDKQEDIKMAKELINKLKSKNLLDEWFSLMEKARRSSIQGNKLEMERYL